MEIAVKNINDLKKVIECIKKSGRHIIILSGTLGSGKTTLVKEFVKSLGVKDDVTSPTFSIQNIYSGNVFHYDLYNKNENDFMALGMLEELEKEGYHFLEWGEGLEEVFNLYGIDYLKINIILKDGKRYFKCQN